ncbi:hypothetical protein PCASD_16145 [Puccinia coronata f. sp. avenae]|uniref:Uncharacterized protein n=1 Tax=Puccinia coronata f. sp. avenae TaxID=200324 RepID=A0A2N5TAL0_9BASI|nr:hypothetical protein PCASD_16145 [Puccinia coronata f. sp. avenae]
MQPGSTYAVNGHLTVLDDNTTYALTFDPDDAVVSAGDIPAQEERHVLIDSVGTIASISFSSFLLERGLFQLKAGHTIAIDYTFAPTQFTAHFASQLTLGHKIRLSGELAEAAHLIR